MDLRVLLQELRETDGLSRPSLSSFSKANTASKIMKILKKMPPDYNNIEYLFVCSYAVLLATQTLQHQLSKKERIVMLSDAEYNLREALKLLNKTNQTAPRMEVKWDIHFLIGRIIFEKILAYGKVPDNVEEYMKEICVNLEIANKGISQIVSSMKKKKDELKPFLEKQNMIFLFFGIVLQQWSNIKKFKWEQYTLSALEMYKLSLSASKDKFKEMYYISLKNMGFLLLDYMNRKRNEIPMNKTELEKVFKQCEEVWERLCRENPEDPQTYIMWALAIYEYVLVLLPTANLLPPEQQLHYRFRAPW